MALQEAGKLRAGRPLVAMIHFPPLYEQVRDTDFTRLFERYQVSTVVYGHLHGPAIRAGFNGTHRGVRYMLTSCDSLNFALTEVSMEN